MKPRVFLSHSKKDKALIKQLAEALRPARIDVWYDDWEIPPGASLRTKIFEEGIPGCDLFFVYLTSHSSASRWVKQELDAAFVTELEEQGGFLCLYVDSDQTRDALPLDLRSRKSPTLIKENLPERLLELTALAWETFSRSQVRSTKSENRIKILELEKRVLELELENEKLSAGTISDFEETIEVLQAEDLIKAFMNFAFRVGEGVFIQDLDRDIVRLVVVNLIDVRFTERWGIQYFLTDHGKSVARAIHIRGLDRR